MTDREKLIEILAGAIVEHTVCSSDGHPVSRYLCRIVAEDEVDILTDYLISNGVVVREKGEWERKKVAFHVGCPSCGCYVRDNAEQVFLDDGTLNFCPHCGSDMRGAVNDG